MASLSGTSSADTLVGAANESNSISGLNGDDSLVGGNLKDSLQGGNGHDTLDGGDQNDMLAGGQGFDWLNGGGGADMLIGGSDDDVMEGGNGNDTFEGGTGNDWLSEGAGADTYLFARGDGQDHIGSNAYASMQDTILFGSSITFEDLEFSHDQYTDAMVIRLAGTSDSISIADQFYGNGYGIEQLRFEDGTVIPSEELPALIKASDADDYLVGSTIADSIDALGGNDTVFGEDGNDSLSGGTGDDYLYGGNGSNLLLGGNGEDFIIGGGSNDTLSGGTGTDILVGDGGDDVYVFSRGEGIDHIYNFGAYGTFSSNPHGTTTITFGNDISPTDVQFSLDFSLDFSLPYYSTLVLALAGTADAIVVDDYFGDTLQVINEIRFADGTVIGSGELNLLVAPSSNSEIVRGNDNANTIDALDGNDQIIGFAGNDTLSGNSGNDSLIGGGDNDLLTGGTGTDNLLGGDGNDTLAGNEGNDTFIRSAGNDVYLFSRGDGQDSLFCPTPLSLTDTTAISFVDNVLQTDIQLLLQGSQDLLIQLAGSTDSIRIANHFSGATYAVDEFRFADGSVLSAENFDTISTPTTGNNFLAGNSSNNFINALAGNDRVEGREGNDSVIGAAGDDSLLGGNDNDVLYGSSGNDVVYGGFGNDVLGGGSGNDTLWGAAGADRLYGRAGNDFLNGGIGRDLLIGGIGYDTLAGGAGNDTFVFGAGMQSSVDLLRDFSHAEGDRIQIYGGEIGLAHSGELDESQFAGGAFATTETQRFVFNSNTGNLYYDADGSASGAAIHFATLALGTVLTAADIVIA